MLALIIGSSYIIMHIIVYISEYNVVLLSLFVGYLITTFICFIIQEIRGCSKDIGITIVVCSVNLFFLLFDGFMLMVLLSFYMYG